MTDVAEFSLLLLGIAIVGCVARFGWECAGGLARRVQHHFLPAKKEFELRMKRTSDGAEYWAAYDDWGRLIYVERANADSPAPPKEGA